MCQRNFSQRKFAGKNSAAGKLLALAGSLGISGTSKLRKGELVDAINEAQNAATGSAAPAETESVTATTNRLLHPLRDGEGGERSSPGEVSSFPAPPSRV